MKSKLRKWNIARNNEWKQQGGVPVRGTPVLFACSQFMGFILALNHNAEYRLEN
jgi:hypothetical protein